MRRLDLDSLQIRRLRSVLLRCLVAPTDRVRVSDVLCVIALLAADLTYLSHCSKHLNAGP